ncbi:DUF4783 domain-containing protein [Sphingobacteriales bacterium UPWRP_1]|nr:hypothetical protein BVG80_13925 [Sphingobacteriales bacterium TSM_CSM]PSJ77079.1 DUF4783 domain-containing protein [Sphingobacteriales bacterium UPWRP_1]
MKKLFWSASFMVIFLLTVPLQAQSNINESVRAALKSGNAASLAQHFAANLDVVTPEEDDRFSKTEAVLKLSYFFSQYRPTSFVVKHETNAPNGARYLIGNLSTSGGIFRTSMLIRNNTIVEIAFEQ